MKLRELISKTTISMAALPLLIFSTSNCKAAETMNYYSMVKDNILQSKTYDEFYDVNDDGIVNVFDAIRINKNEYQSEIIKEITDLKSDLYNDFTVNPGIFPEPRRLEPDGTYSVTDGYRVFETPPHVKKGDRICFLITDKTKTMLDAELRYMFASNDMVFTETFVIDSGKYNIFNLEYITVPTNIEVSSIFMSFSEKVADCIRVFVDNSSSNALSNMYGSSREILNINSNIILDANAPTSLTELANNTLYRIQVTQQLSWLPSDFVYDGMVNFIISIYTTSDNIDRRLYYIYDKTFKPIYCRYVEGDTDYGWENIAPHVSEVTEITVGVGQTYLKLTDALAYAYSKGNVKITVKKGIYDFVSECNLNNVSSAGSGPVIGNNTHLYFEQGAEIVCNYTGTNQNIRSIFSPLNAGIGDFIMENVKITSKNTRYCVHDELNSDDTPYKHEYINCDMYLDNSGNAWDSPQCIGGGLGEKGYIVIDGGYYDSLPVDNIGYYGAISYHNGHTSGCKSSIYIKNVCMNNSTARFGYYGSSTDMTKIMVTGCKLKLDPTLRAETSDGSSPNVNMAITAFNNTIG